MIKTTQEKIDNLVNSGKLQCKIKDSKHLVNKILDYTNLYKKVVA